MTKSIRRIIISLLVVTVAMSAILTAFAMPAASGGNMESALIAAKSLLNIDDDVYTDFSYSSGYSNYATREGLLWQFSWSDADSNYIYAVVSEDGVLMQYSKYNYSANYFGFADISRDDAIRIADEFIRNAKPDSYSYYKAPADINVSIHNGDYRLSYYAEVNGRPFKAASVSVGVNKFTGEVTNYSASNISPTSYNFGSAAGIIGESAAIDAYADKIGLSLEYRSYYNYTDETVKVYPVYMFNSSGDRYIGAATGDIIEYVYDRGQDQGVSYGALNDMAAPEASALAGSGSTSASLTPTEIAAIDRVGNFITNEQALEKLLDVMGLTDIDVNSFNDKYISLGKDYVNRDRYIYDIGFYRYYGEVENKSDDIMSFNGRVDAESGRVTSFSFNYFGMNYSDEYAYTPEQAGSAVEAFLENIAPDEYAKTEKNEEYSMSVSPYEYGGEYYANYIRYANDIPFRNNGISVTYNLSTGKITRFNLNWYDNATFPPIDNVMTPRDALGVYTAQNGSEVGYITTGNGNAELVYDFIGMANIDPFTGKALDYAGEPWEDSEIKPDYSDVEGHWSEAVVKRLLDNGIYLWSGKFEPNKVMTELEFLEYLLLLERYYYGPEPVAYFTEKGVDIDADPDKELNRQEAVRIIVEYLGYKKLANQPAWFIYPFSDEVDDEYKGYVTICYMLGIIGGENGRFNAENSITRAQAAVILQNIILLES